MFSGTVEPFEVAAVIEQDRRFHNSSSSSSTVVADNDDESNVPLVSRSSSSSSSLSSSPARPVVSRRSSFSSLLESLRVNFDSMRANVTQSVSMVQHGVQEKASSLTNLAEAGVKQWTSDMKNSIEQLMGTPNSLVCGGCQRELSIPQSAFQWVCTKGHENNFVEPNCKYQQFDVGVREKQQEEVGAQGEKKERAIERAVESTPAASISSSSPSSPWLCGEARPPNLEWPSVRCPFPSCSHITLIPRTQASAILRAGVSTLSSSVFSLSHPPSAMFHCGFCNCLLSVPIGEWQCQACTEICSETATECQKCGHQKSQQKLLCGLCHHSTSIPNSSLTDSIRSGLKAMKEQARKLAFTAIGQVYCECPYCGHGQAITDEMLELGSALERTKLENDGYKEKNTEIRITTGHEETLGASKVGIEKYESRYETQIKSSSSSSYSSVPTVSSSSFSASSSATPTPTSADADLLLATSTIPPPSAMFSLSDHPIPCQLCSNSFYVLYGKEEGENETNRNKKEKGLGKEIKINEEKGETKQKGAERGKGGKIMARRQSSVKGNTQTQEKENEEGPKKVEDTEDLIDKTLAAP